jgi:hypothetical protein
MQNQCNGAMAPPHDCNPIMHLQEKLGFNVILNNRPSKWFKLVKLYVVMVLGFVEDECTFSNLVFMKIKLCNHLMTHFDLFV